MKETLNIKITLFTTIFCAMVLLLLNGASFAYTNSPSTDLQTLKGKIVSIDPKQNVVTVESSQIGQPSTGGRMDVFLNRQTKINDCDETKIANEQFYLIDPWPTLKKGEANITFHEDGGVAVADAISQKC